jgi:hypothetical protein
MSIHPRQGLPRDYHYNIRDWDGWYSGNPLGGRSAAAGAATGMPAGAGPKTGFFAIKSENWSTEVRMINFELSE